MQKSSKVFSKKKNEKVCLASSFDQKNYLLGKSVHLGSILSNRLNGEKNLLPRTVVVSKSLCRNVAKKEGRKKKAFLSCIPQRLFFAICGRNKGRAVGEGSLLFPLKKGSKTKVTFLADLNLKVLDGLWCNISVWRLETSNYPHSRNHNHESISTTNSSFLLKSQFSRS